MKTLVFCPINPISYRSRWPESIDRTLSLESLGSMSFHFEKSRISNETTRDVCEKFRLARRLFLESDYDLLLTVEDDMLIPPESLLRLESHKADVAYGLYVARSMKSHPWLVAYWLNDTRVKFLSGRPNVARNAWGKAIHSHGLGMGCTLIRRHVMEELDFRVLSGPGWGHGKSNDWYFALDARRRGMTQVTDLGLVCGHIRNNGMVLWPDPNSESLYREEVLWER